MIFVMSYERMYTYKIWIGRQIKCLHIIQYFPPLIRMISAFCVFFDFIREHKTGLSMEMIIKKMLLYFPKIRTFGLSSMIFHGDKNLMNLLWDMKKKEEKTMHILGKSTHSEMKRERESLYQFIFYRVILETNQRTPFLWFFVKLNITTTIIIFSRMRRDTKLLLYFECGWNKGVAYYQ